MSSGAGIFTSRGRCYPFWKEMIQCHDASIFPSRDCLQHYEDYMECLHRTKEVSIMFSFIHLIVSSS